MSVCPRNLTLNILGHPTDFDGRMLPTREDTLKYYFYVWYGLKEDNGGSNPSFKEAAALVLKRVTDVWSSASIPVVSVTRMEQLLQHDVSTYQQLNKSFKRDSEKDAFKKKVSDFHDQLRVLFDVAACKCNSCICKCSLQDKVPAAERDFLQDQRTSRKMIIGPVDKKTTAMLRKREERKAIEEIRANKRPLEDVSASSSSAVCASDDKTSENCIEDADFNVPALSANRSRVKLPRLTSFARKCDRFGIGDRAAASLASSLLQDLSLSEVSSDETMPTTKDPLIIDKSKVRRERTKTQREVTEQEFQDTTLEALFFDGRDDNTLTIETTSDGRQHQRVVKENHLSLVKQPGDEYFGHVTSESHRAEDEFKSIWTYLQERTNGDLSTLRLAGCDGAPTNTGIHNGIIRRMEEELGRPLQWNVCQLHTNELPLRHVIETIDGPAIGPTGFSGPIGKLLQNCESLPVKKFKAIPCELPEIERDKLSTDQLYLYDICKAVSCGVVSDELANKKPGKMHHARWLTTGSRILRLYVSTPKCLANLKNLATFVVTVYAPSWFRIRREGTLKNASKILWHTMIALRTIPKQLKKVAQNVLQDNAFHAHHENILVAMIHDERKEVRQQAARRILQARERSSSNIVRKFVPPILNFSANDYTEMIEWPKEKISEPPITTNLTDIELRRIIEDQFAPMPDVQLANVASHTQSVERVVKEVTEASNKKCGPTARDGFIRVRLQDRKLVPKFESKKDFKT